MSKKDSENLEVNQDFEFNDGIGGVLREKELYKFSWLKTVSVLMALLVVVVLISVGILELGKRMFVKHTEVVETIDIEHNSIDVIMSDVNNDSWESLPEEPVPQASVPVSDKEQPNSMVESTKNLPQLSSNSDDSQLAMAQQIPSKKEPAILQTSSSEKVAIKSSQIPPDKAQIRPAQAQVSVAPATIKKTSKKIDKPTPIYRVIAGSYSKFSNAKSALNKLEAIGFKGFIWETKTNSITIFKIQLAAFSSIKYAKQFQVKLSSKNIESYIDSQ